MVYHYGYNITNTTNFILLQSSREKLEFFFTAHSSRTYSHCSGCHQSLASPTLQCSFICISSGEVLTIHGRQSGFPILSVSWVVQAWRGSTDQGWQRKSYSATTLIIRKDNKHSGELPVHHREMQTYYFSKNLDK